MTLARLSALLPIGPLLLTGLSGCMEAGNRGVDTVHAPVVSQGRDGRLVATVPGCPDWSRPLQPEYAAATTSDYGCATRSNLAAMIADPRDLIEPAADGSTDAYTAAKAIRSWRDMPSTGRGGLEKITARGDGK